MDHIATYEGPFSTDKKEKSRYWFYFGAYRSNTLEELCRRQQVLHDLLQQPSNSKSMSKTKEKIANANKNGHEAHSQSSLALNSSTHAAFQEEQEAPSNTSEPMEMDDNSTVVPSLVTERLIVSRDVPEITTEFVSPHSVSIIARGHRNL